MRDGKSGRILLTLKSETKPEEQKPNYYRESKKPRAMRSIGLSKFILIGIFVISLSGCAGWFTEVVFIPTEECQKYTQPLLDEKDKHIDILMDELHYKSEQLRDCERMVVE